MKFIKLVFILIWASCLYGQKGVHDIDTIKLKKYIGYLKNQGDYETAAHESIGLATHTHSDVNVIEALKLNVRIDSFEKVDTLVPLIQDSTELSRWMNIQAVFRSDSVIRGADSIYLNFLRIAVSRNYHQANLYFKANEAKLKEYYFSDKFYKAINSPPKKRRLAAALSLFPGLGKLYIGRKVDAFASFFNTSLLTGVTFIFAHHLGNHPLTYISAGLAGGFYVAGIVGTQSSLSHDRAFNEEILYEETNHSFKHYISGL